MHDEVARTAQALVEHCVDPILVTAPDGRTLAANRAACALLGRTEDELRAIGRDGIADPADERWRHALETRARDGAFRGLLRVRRKDGSLVEVDLSTAVFDGPGGEQRSYALFRDVSAQSGVLEQAATVVEIIESIAESFLTVDRDWALRYMNRRGQETLGARWEEVRGRSIWELYPHVVGTESEERMRRVMSTRRPDVYEQFDTFLNTWLEGRVNPLRGGGLSISFQDVSHRHAVEEERERLLAAERAARAAAEHAQVALQHRASHDDLTGLLNRTGLHEAFAEALDGGAPASTSLVFVDLDRFKLVNDSLGHGAGDEVLAEVGRRLDGLVPPGGLLARFGGDEFVLIVFDAEPAEVDALAHRVLDATREPVHVGPRALRVAASAGIARTAGTARLEMLLRDADAALYRAKDAGRERAAWFDEPVHEHLLRKIDIERELRAALTRSGLALHYQPSFELGDGRARHVEALARWTHPVRGPVSPAEFVCVAEESGLIEELGSWVIAEAARQTARWSGVPDLRVWVNVSPRQLAVPAFATELEATLGQHGVAPERFGIEVTESAFGDDAALAEQVAQVRELGVQVAIDDFGTGYSSLARLTQARVDVIKIDRSFVAGAHTSRGYAILSGIASLTRSLGAAVIAEGVETTDQLERVAQAGCRWASGYLLARPAPAEEIRWTAAQLNGHGPTDR